MTEQPDRTEHVVAWVQRTRLLRPSVWPRSARIGASVAGLILFVVLIVTAVDGLAFELRDLNLLALILLLLTAPAPLILSAREYQVMAESLQPRSVPRREALGIALGGYLANHLPLPGGSVVRIGALSRHASVGRSTVMTVSVGGLWLGASLLAAALGSTALGYNPTAWALLGPGLVSTALALVLLAKGRTQPVPLGSFVRVELLFVVVALARTLLALWTLGFDTNMAIAAVLSASSSLATAIGLAPAGIGVRELISGGLGTLIGMPMAVGVLVAGLLRAAGALGAAVLYTFLSTRSTE